MAFPELFFCDQGCRIELWRNVAIVDVADEMNVARVRQLAEAYRTLLGSYTQVAGMCVMRPAAPTSAPEGREEAAELLRSLGPKLAHCALVYEAEGVFAQLLRTVVRGFNVITRNKVLTLHANIAEGTQALARHVLGCSTLDQARNELRDALAITRARFDKQLSAGG